MKFLPLVPQFGPALMVMLLRGRFHSFSNVFPSSLSFSILPHSSLSFQMVLSPLSCRFCSPNRSFFRKSTTFAIENAPPSPHDNLLQNLSILKNKKGFENYFKFSSNLWKPHPSVFNRLKMGKVSRQIVIFWSAEIGQSW